VFLLNICFFGLSAGCLFHRDILIKSLHISLSSSTLALEAKCMIYSTLNKGFSPVLDGIIWHVHRTSPLKIFSLKFWWNISPIAFMSKIRISCSNKKVKRLATSLCSSNFRILDDLAILILMLVRLYFWHNFINWCVRQLNVICE
jgi:hypothetical protein